VTDAEAASSVATAVAARVRELVPTAWAACLVRGGDDPEGAGSWSAAGSDGDVPPFLQDWLRGGQALPDEATEGASEYGWYEEGHPIRVTHRHVRPFLDELEPMLDRVVPARDERLQEGVLLFVGRKRDRAGEKAPLS
jgi:hypothetical protein